MKGEFNITLNDIMSYKLLPLEEQVLLFSPSRAWPADRPAKYPPWTKMALTLTFGSVVNRIFNKLVCDRVYDAKTCEKVPLTSWMKSKDARIQYEHLVQSLRSDPQGLEKFQACVDAVLLTVVDDRLKHSAIAGFCPSV